ncbi:MAG TPA: type II secretion system F family protein [Verrucomicrobiae bacterium]|jgi:type II secretory pathway component PulF|nr:type II secretion system F family protein [Verrucomicrobiae bacterium]
MAQFSYKARRRTGELVQGVLEVADRSAAVLQIERLGLLPVAIDAPRAADAAKGAESGGKPGGARWKASVPTTGLLPPALREWMTKPRKPKLQELATFTQQLSNLLRSGMPLTVALNSMTHLGSKGISSEVGKQLRQDVTEGKSLSDAMGRQPVIFSDLYINMVRAGEQSGALVEVLQRLATHFERFAEVQAKFTSALIYPAVVACVGVGIMIFFMTYMMPKFMSIFEGIKGLQLPMTTLFLMNSGKFFGHYWWAMVLVILTLVVLFKRFQSSTAGRRTLDRWKLNAPIFGRVNKLHLYGQFARTLGTLLHNGVPVLTALKITEQVIPNVILKEAIGRTREEVTDGKTIAQPMARSKVFPQLMVDLLRIGEETGDVPGALENLANTYENELTIALRVVMNLIEPAMIIFMALMVGFLLLSVLSAMFAITSNIGQNF